LPTLPLYLKINYRKKWLSRKVIDGDKHDLRFKDPSGVIVGLVAKGLGRKDLNNSFIKIAS
jgi:hypothetical protein